MTNSEKIIRKEAEEFINSSATVEKFDLATYEGRKKLIQKIREEIENYYAPESKMIFLDEILKTSKGHKENHVKNEYECELLKGRSGCYGCDAWDAVMFFIEQEINKLPKIINKTTTESSKYIRNSVFISYSHEDKPYLAQLKRHFAPFNDKISFWDDENIRAGQKWKEEINKAINTAKVGILLISADFFNSKFIKENELPPLLEAAKNDGANILNVILKPCMYDEYDELNKYQAINNPNFTIAQMDEVKRELTWVELVKQVKEIMNL